MTNHSDLYTAIQQTVDFLLHRYLISTAYCSVVLIAVVVLTALGR